MLVETFSLMNIVESGKYSRGNCDSKPGYQAPYSAGSGSIIIAHPPVLVTVSNKSEFSAAYQLLWSFAGAELNRSLANQATNNLKLGHYGSKQASRLEEHTSELQSP